MLIGPDWFIVTTECLLFLFIHILLPASSSQQMHGVHSLGYEKPCSLFFQQHMFCSHHCLRQQQFCPLHLINCSGVSEQSRASACLLGEQTDGTIPAAWPTNLVSLLSQSPLFLWSGQALCLPEWSLSTSLLHSSHDSTLLLIRNTSLFTPVKTLKPTWRKEIWH